MKKRKFLLLCITLIALTNCKTSQMKSSAIPKTGMFKVEILYPNGDDKTFDMDYYEKKHMPMMAGFIGKNLVFYEIDKGIAQNIDTILNDIKKYTNIQPTLQISEIKQLKQTNTK